jgi:Ca2+-binding EF-hand superfamily protein
MLDRDGDGAISLDEFKDMMKNFGGKLSNEELQNMITEHDIDRE